MNTPVRTSIATVSLSGTLEEKLVAIAAAGFDGFEVFEPDFVASPWSPKELRTRAADLGLSLDLYQPFRDFDSVNDGQFARNLVRAQRKFELMEELGCETLLVCSSPLPAASHDDGQLVEQFSALAELASEHGKKVAYEALAWGAHVNTYGHAWRIVEEVDHPSLGTCLDSFHILSRGDDPAGIRDIPGEKIFFLQLADAPFLAMDILQWSRHHRNFPGQGSFDLSAFAGHVHAAGYTGPWSLEIFNDVFRRADTQRTAVDAHRSLLHLEEQVAAAVSVGDGPELFTAPERTPLEGIVSLRVAAGPAKQDQLHTMLSSVGFHLVGRHRDHDLQLWRHGLLTIAVDATAGTVWSAPGLPADLPVLTQIGIRASEPAVWGQRARALEVPVEQVRLPGSADENAEVPDVVRLKVTDATSIDLRGPGSAAAWESAFDIYPRSAARNRAEASVLTGIDHVALAVPAESWDSVMLLLRSVFEMHPHEGLDVTDSVGLMRSQALTLVQDGSGNTLRVSLNMVDGSRSGLPTVRRGGVSHVAFSCDNIFAAAAAMADWGYAPLPISPNYYEDLEARFGLNAELLDRMRAAGILYDADAHGEFFHLFTPTVGADLFFEVVQRVGGYEGYGEVNSAVRLSAQLRAE
ncbi:TIM barrel protein [Rhodococcus sp. NPDC056743]|uniref:sugar phosphate isomerase/epimerase and 4-hydroxyphenylpyruvate domain-containing protein n=1 Tax=Rhodococcus sp. NPDC056743 TaxID=3345934 RepID=UPI00366B6D32